MGVRVAWRERNRALMPPRNQPFAASSASISAVSHAKHFYALFTGELDLNCSRRDCGESRSEVCHEPLPREAVAHPHIEVGIARDTLRGRGREDRRFKQLRMPLRRPYSAALAFATCMSGSDAPRRVLWSRSRCRFCSRVAVGRSRAPTSRCVYRRPTRRRPGRGRRTPATDSRHAGCGRASSG